MLNALDTDFDHQITPDALRDAIDELGLNQKDFAEQSGVKYRALNDFLNGSRKNLKPSEERLVRMRLRGDPDGGAERGGLAEAFARQDPRGNVPMFSADGDGVLRLNAAGRVGATPAHPDQATNPRAFAVLVFDDSYAPRFRPGEKAYAIFNMAPRIGYDCIVEMKDGAGLVGEFVERTAGVVKIRQAASGPGADRPRSIPAADVRAIHAIVGRGG